MRLLIPRQGPDAGRKSTFATVGARRLVPGLAALLVVLTTGCGQDAGGQQARGGGRGGGPGGRPDEPPALVAVQPVVPGTSLSRYATTATLEAENRAQVLARTGGVVLRLLCEEGDFVGDTQELLILDDSELKLRLRQAEVELAKQRVIFQRQKTTFEQEIISEADFEIAKTNFETAEANHDLAKHELSYTRVQTPFQGTVVHRLVQLGQTVQIGTPLFEIANFKPLLARVFVPAKGMGTLRVGQDVQLVLDSSGARFNGTVRLVSPVVDPQTGTVKVTVDIEKYPPGTRPGDFAKVSIVTDRHEDVLRVPNTAVFEDKGERIVYVARDSVAERRPVDIGFIEETHTEIVAGLVQGDLVIVKGQRSLQEGDPIRFLEEEKDAGVVTTPNPPAKPVARRRRGS